MNAASRNSTSMGGDRPLVIVTRAAPGHLDMTRRLAAAGHDVLACPLQRRDAIDETAMARRFDGLGPVDAVVATSPHAAEVALRALGRHRLAGRVLVAPGPGTAAALERAGLDVDRPEQGGTSEHVLALPVLAPDRVAGRRVVILAAPGGRMLITDTLSERGACVERLTPYRREPVAPPPALHEALDAGRSTVTLLSSAAALRTLHDALPSRERDRWLAGRFVVSSDRLARKLDRLGAKRVDVATGAGEAALAETLGPAAGR